MSKLRAPTALALMLTLAGCTTVGPNYKLPASALVNAPVVKGEFLGAKNESMVDRPPPDHWWRLYQDQLLDRLEDEALAANTDLRVAAANIRQARSISSQTRSQLDEPHMQLSAGAERAQLSGESYLLPMQMPDMTLGDVGFSMSYQVDLFGRLKRAAEASEADVEAARAGYDLVRVTVAANVAAAYVDVCSAGEELAAAEQSIDLQAKSLEATRRLALAGRGQTIDIARAEAQLMQLRATPPALAARRQAALYRLAALMGRTPLDYPRDVERCAEPPRLATPLPVGDGASLLQRRPDVRAAERRLASATARIGVAAAALYPSVGLGLDSGSSGKLTDLGRSRTNSWNLGGLIHWSFPDTAARARVRQASAGADAALASFDGVVLNALRETETSLSAYAQDLQRNAALRVARDQSAKAAAEARRLYQGGRSAYLSSLDAERSLANMDASVAASDGQLAADQVRLFLALGGGWAGAD
ncbi:MAG: efflux transporter outer membrane subunit [Pseudomonadota bacterium]